MARQASELTLAIRKLLNDRKGDITHSQAVPLLAEQGHPNVDAVTFNGTKAIWKRRKDEKRADKAAGKAGKVKTEVTTERALATVREYGGIKKAKEFARTLVASIKVAEAELAALA